MPKKLQNPNKKFPKIKHWQTLLAPTLLIAGLSLIIFQIKFTQQTNTNAQIANCTVAPAELTVDPEEQKLIQLVNTYRQQNGRQPLQLNNNLTRAASWLAHDMATKNYLSHTDTLARAPDKRMTDCGYSTFNVNNGENIAGNTPDANTTFTQWKNSPVHNANMLNTNYVAVGVGHTLNNAATLKNYWALDFGALPDSPLPSNQTQPSNAQQPASPTPTPPPASPSFGCLGPCITLTPTQPAETPTSPITPTTESSIAPSSTNPSGAQITDMPTTAPSPNLNNNQGFLGILLAIIAIILGFLRNLF